MKTIEVAQAFLAGRKAKCHNAHTDGRTYWLHGHAIASKYIGFGFSARIEFNWCGYHTVTTAQHMNKIIECIGGNVPRVSYARARDAGERVFVVDMQRRVVLEVIETKGEM